MPDPTPLTPERIKAEFDDADTCARAEYRIKRLGEWASRYGPDLLAEVKRQAKIIANLKLCIDSLSAEVDAADLKWVGKRRGG